MIPEVCITSKNRPLKKIISHIRNEENDIKKIVIFLLFKKLFEVKTFHVRLTA